MRTRLALAVLFVCSSRPVTAAEPIPIRAVVESSLATGGGHIRQFAFDGDPNSYFASEKHPGKDDHFTLVFDAPVTVKTVAVTTGKPEGADKLMAGSLEGSDDGKTFVAFAKFIDGTAHGAPVRKLKAVRVTPGKTSHPLVVRDFEIESDPSVATFKYPVEVIVASDDPEMLEWVTKAGHICEHEYDMINEELKSDGFKPTTTFTMTMKKDYDGVAATSFDRSTRTPKVVGSVDYFKRRKNDFGAMVHETVHVVQAYRRGGNRNPGWLVEGIADYVRFFKYEPGKIGRINPDRWKYDGAYRQTAHFLNYVTEKYDKDIVRKLNKAMREGEYKDELWKLYTKKSMQELGDEWKATLKR